MESNLAGEFGYAQAAFVPNRCYMICATPRTGTNLLCEALWRTGFAGRPQEHFLAWAGGGAEDPIPRAEHLRKVLADGSTPNGVFGVKIMGGEFDVILGKLRTIAGDHNSPAALLLGVLFPNLRYIRVLRRDKVRQAVSLAKAVQSNRWLEFESAFNRTMAPDWARELAAMRPEWARMLADHLGIDEPTGQTERARANAHPPTDTLRYDFEQIAGFHQEMLEHEGAWDRYFTDARTSPFLVTYEDLVADHDATVFAVLDYLDLPKPDSSPLRCRSLRRQSDAVNEEWVARYVAQQAGYLGA